MSRSGFRREDGVWDLWEEVRPEPPGRYGPDPGVPVRGRGPTGPEVVPKGGSMG